ncbi:hypothetical protein ABPG75_001380 [Micractinium tetrahymenae]
MLALAKRALRSRRARYLAAAGGLTLLLLALSLHCSSGEGACSAAKSVIQGAGRQGEPSGRLQHKFEEIYEYGGWGLEGNGSGPGSTFNATVSIREILGKAIEALDVNSMIDVPCGAMAWMPLLLEEVERTRPKFRYLGLDIAASVVAQNKRAFAAKAAWRFDSFDLSAQPLPRGYDLVHTRDALQHLSCPTGVAALRNLAHSGARYLLVGSYNSTANVQIENGAHFDINLKAHPYNLDRPLAVFPEASAPGPPKFMLLYSVEELRKQDFAAMQLRCAFPQACPGCP